MTREDQIRNKAIDYSEHDIKKAFISGAKWADRSIIEKACKWLDSVNTDYYMDSGIFQMYDLIIDFKKAMTDE